MAAPMTDITGYRSDGGALGQDQGVSKELRSILTSKLPLLSAPGAVMENSLYYDINSSSVTAVEEQETFAKDRIVLNNFVMGSAPSCYLPSVLFTGNAYWFIELPDITLPANANVNDPAWAFCAPHGWGFAALKDITVYMGASNIANLTIGWLTNFLISAATCETESKVNKMVHGAGQYLYWPDVRSVLAKFDPNKYAWRNKSYTDPYNPNQGDANTKPENPCIKLAVVPLRLPWTSMAALQRRLSFDTKLLTQPIQITISTRPLSEFIYAGFAMKALIGDSWKESSVQCWQEELSDKSLSVRNALMAMPEFNVGVPFQYAQTIPFDIVATNDNGSSGFQFLMNITSIINSDLTTFLFQVVWNGRTDPNSGQPCPLFGEKLWDIELKLNGNRFFSFDRESYDSVSICKRLDSSRASLIMPSRNVTVGNAAPTQVGFLVESNIYEFNNSRLRSIVAENNMQNTARFTNQTFQLSFKVNRNIGYLLFPTGAPTSLTYNSGYSKLNGYSVNMTYLYNAVFLAGGDGGTSKLITN